MNTKEKVKIYTKSQILSTNDKGAIGIVLKSRTANKAFGLLVEISSTPSPSLLLLGIYEALIGLLVGYQYIRSHKSLNVQKIVVFVDNPQVASMLNGISVVWNVPVLKIKQRIERLVSRLETMNIYVNFDEVGYFDEEGKALTAQANLRAWKAITSDVKLHQMFLLDQSSKVYEVMEA